MAPHHSSVAHLSHTSHVKSIRINYVLSGIRIAATTAGGENGNAHRKDHGTRISGDRTFGGPSVGVLHRRTPAGPRNPATPGTGDARTSSDATRSPHRACLCARAAHPASLAHNSRLG